MCWKSLQQLIVLKRIKPNTCHRPSKRKVKSQAHIQPPQKATHTEECTCSAWLMCSIDISNVYKKWLTQQWSCHSFHYLCVRFPWGPISNSPTQPCKWRNSRRQARKWGLPLMVQNVRRRQLSEVNTACPLQVLLFKLLKCVSKKPKRKYMVEALHQISFILHVPL